MRRVVDVLAVCVAALLMAGVGYHFFRVGRHEARVSEVRRAIETMERHVRIHAGQRDVDLNAHGWPTRIDPAWFKELPRNSLLDPNRPWLEIAEDWEGDQTDPSARVAATGDLASFWYNARRGIVRARVPLEMSDEAAVRLYNRVNGSNVREALEVRVPVMPPAATAAAEENLDPTIPLPPRAP